MRYHRFVSAALVCSPLVSSACAQVAAQRHVVQDWSTQRVVFTGLTQSSVDAAAEREPRVWLNWMAHERHGFAAINQSTGAPATTAMAAGRTNTRELPTHQRHRRRHPKELKVDWQMPIPGFVGPRSFPAKFGFDVNVAPDCVNDFVVFPTTGTAAPGASGAGIAPSVVGFNNLYTGPGPSGICPTPIAPAQQPSVLFAYNTATTELGQAHSSPVLSLDGKKIAFVESNDGFTNDYTAFHVLTWKAGEGTTESTVVPGDCSPGNSCITTLVLSNVHSDSNSSPFIDYANDTAFVGTDGTLLHKITPVFNGTPTEVIGNGWPVQLPLGLVGSPVFDSVSGRVFVTTNSGSLIVVDAASGATVNAVDLAAIFPSDPIVDSTNQTVFVFFASSTNLHLMVAQFDTSGTLLRQIDAGRLGGDANVYTGAFDNNYFTDPASGSLYFAGAVNFVGSLFSVGFSGKTMNATFSGPLLLSDSPNTSAPLPLTEIFNPSLGASPDRLFLGIEEDCNAGSPNGCVLSLDISHGFPAGILDSRTATDGAAPSMSGIIVDNVSAAPQASSIYFESSPPTSSSRAFKLTQSGLQ